MKIPNFFRTAGKEFYHFAREAAAATVGEVFTKEVEKRSADKRGEVVAAIEAIADPDVRKALLAIHRYWWKVKKNENLFVEQLAKIPVEAREDIFTNLAYLWAAGQTEEVEQIFYMLEHDWWQQLLKKPFVAIGGVVESLTNELNAANTSWEKWLNDVRDRHGLRRI